MEHQVGYNINSYPWFKLIGTLQRLSLLKKETVNNFYQSRTLKSHSFCQACAVTNKDFKDEVDREGERGSQYPWHLKLSAAH